MTDAVRHYGPGDHPSGSPQAVHAGGDRVDIAPPDEATEVDVAELQARAREEADALERDFPIGKVELVADDKAGGRTSQNQPNVIRLGPWGRTVAGYAAMREQRPWYQKANREAEPDAPGQVNDRWGVALDHRDREVECLVAHEYAHLVHYAAIRSGHESAMARLVRRIRTDPPSGYAISRRSEMRQGSLKGTEAFAEAFAAIRMGEPDRWKLLETLRELGLTTRVLGTTDVGQPASFGSLNADTCDGMMDDGVEARHYGPGNHPSGSSQDAHAGGKSVEQQQDDSLEAKMRQAAERIRVRQEAEGRLVDLGYKAVDFGYMEPEHVAVVTETLADLAARYPSILRDLSVSIGIDGSGQGYAVTYPWFHQVSMTFDARWFEDATPGALLESLSRDAASGWSTTGSVSGLVRHEFGHIVDHWLNRERSFDGKPPAVSKYAHTDDDEAFAELFAAVEAGQTFTDPRARESIYWIEEARK